MIDLETKRLSLLPDGIPTDSTDGWVLKDGQLTMTDTDWQKWVKRTSQTVPAMADRNGTTAHTHGDARNGTWHFERMRQQLNVAAEFMTEIESIPTEKKSVMTAGRPGAGKSRFFSDFGDYFRLDCDRIKSEMIRQGMAPDVPGMTPFEGAQLIHTESNYIGMILFDEAVRRGTNIVLEQTMSSDKYAGRRVNTMRMQGYKIRGLFVDVSSSTSKRRCGLRHRSGVEDFLARGEGFGGRFIPHFISDLESRQVFDYFVRAECFVSSEYFKNDTDGEEPTLFDPKMPVMDEEEDYDEEEDDFDNEEEEDVDSTKSANDAFLKLLAAKSKPYTFPNSTKSFGVVFS